MGTMTTACLVRNASVMHVSSQHKVFERADIGLPSRRVDSRELAAALHVWV